MHKKIACLHAHFSNIEYIEKAFSAYEIEFVHFVDPGLIYQVALAGNLQTDAVKNKTKEQIEWMAQCGADAILITCTTYIAVLEEVELSLTVPIIKIDEPFFAYICRNKKPQTMLFSNPATVEGTVKRLKAYAEAHQQIIDFKVVVIPDSFELIMKGLKEQYDQKIKDTLFELIKQGEKVISVAQLSMADGAKEVEKKTSAVIIHPLSTLVSAVVEQMEGTSCKQ
ncbi:aspartate/glutamate racemase family protein [Niallia nealsonii]|uniref:Asp/Glu/hydantoin racemase n=1 Tax=Niallia nealsonii TaxID=115979 RepID=A0A2N0Z1B2_9BACI|nr:aspartate/glutamate racemase family protein [Niallia nealsonii]PKG23302.1 hypothetical protein CWS01_12700 [Niallia nealsonii]